MSVTSPLASTAAAGDLSVSVSPGEFLDRLGILEIKVERIPDPARQTRIGREIELLHRVWRRSPYCQSDVDSHYRALKSVNEQLWEVEDRIREKEARQDFDREFIELARAVYLLNDRRAACKRLINQMLGSELNEEKSYAPYAAGDAVSEPRRVK